MREREERKREGAAATIGERERGQLGLGETNGPDQGSRPNSPM